MILSCHGISKAFSENIVLQDASFILNKYEKAAIVGINGAGKSTLLKIIVGEEQPDSGQVITSGGATIGYLAQQEMLIGGGTIWEELLEARRDVYEAEGKLRSMEIAMKDLSGDALETAMQQYHVLSEWFEQQGGYALRSEITGVLKGLGFAEEEFHKSTGDLSGGEKTRVALGRLLLSSPDILLLDEPTNHLDMAAITWLENFLTGYKGSVLVVAHDRYFLDRIVSKIIEIDRGKVMTFSGNYTDYAKKKEEITQAAMKAWLKQRAQIRHQEEVITRLRSYNREKSIKRAESRVKMLERMDVLERPTQADTDIRLSFEPAFESGTDVLTISDLSKRFDDRLLFDKLSFQIRRGERVAIIGSNGTGKTTILKILNGLVGADSGSFTLGTGVIIGYYDQEHQLLHPDKTLFDEISDDHPDMTETQIRNTLAAFLFTGDDVYKRIADLSGGERGRLSLARLMLSKANFLILDEPTNHLDMFSRQILENALNMYTGTVLYVSHDRYFINQTAQRILELSGQELKTYYGNYDYYLEKKAQEAVAAGVSATSRGSTSGSKGEDVAGSAGLAASSGRPFPGNAGGRIAENASSAGGASTGKNEWEERKAAQAQARKQAARLKAVEEKIALLEEEDAKIDDLLAEEAVFTDSERVYELTTRKAAVTEELEALYAEWETLAE